MSSGREDSLAWQLGLAGAACTVAQGAVHWVETTMVRQQLASVQQNMVATISNIVKTEGAPALYRGFSAAAMRELSYSSLRFGLYEPIKKVLGAKDPATTPFYKKVLAGLLAGAFASAVASPTDLLKIRAQAATGPRESIVEHAKHIANGPSKPWPLNFYRGVSATIVRASCLGATKMATSASAPTTKTSELSRLITASMSGARATCGLMALPAASERRRAAAVGEEVAVEPVLAPQLGHGPARGAEHRQPAVSHFRLHLVVQFRIGGTKTSGVKPIIARVRAVQEGRSR